MTFTGRTELDQLLGNRRIAARAELADAMRMLSARGADTEPTPPAASVRAYHEPRLYCQLAQSIFDVMSLDQLLLATDPLRSDAVDAITDGAGMLCFPGLGHCSTSLAQERVAVRYDATGQTFSIVRDGDEIRTSTLVPTRFIPDTTIEIIEYLDPILKRFLDSNIESPGELTLVDDPDEYTPMLSRAMAIIRHASPVLHASLSESLRGVVLFHHPTAESFAALGMHGMVFINLNEGSDQAFFVEHLVHQGGHVLFSEATLKRGDFFRPEPDSDLAPFVGGNDSRIIYDAFHGLFTEHLECQIFSTVLSGELVADDEREQFASHLRAVESRHAHDLALLEPHAKDIFSDDGYAVYAAFVAAHDEVWQALGKVFGAGSAGATGRPTMGA
jgi:hypothetical protein